MPLRGKVGDVGQIDQELVGCNLTRGVALISIRPQWSATYCKQIIASCSSISRMEQLMNGSALQEIPIATLRSFKIPLPPTRAEQTAIATALSDMDALIEGVEKLLEKKRRIKQGAMQELLTGKRRVSGFESQKGFQQTEVGAIPKDWSVADLGALVEKFVNGGTPSTQHSEYWKGDIPWITGADILNQKIAVIRRYITNEAVQNSSTNVIKRGKLLFVSRTGVGKLAIAPFDIAISQDFTGIYNKPDLLDITFLFWFLNFIQKELLAQNQGTSIQGITRSTLSSIKIVLPYTRAEQTAIAAILSDMDKEIEKIETQLTKYRKLKTGMMQELLTGKKRLV